MKPQYLNDDFRKFIETRGVENRRSRGNSFDSAAWVLPFVITRTSLDGRLLSQLTTKEPHGEPSARGARAMNKPLICLVPWPISGDFKYWIIGPGDLS